MIIWYEGAAYIWIYLITTQLLVGILIDLFENICCGRRVASVDEFNVEKERSTTGNHISSSTLSITEMRWNYQLSLFT